MYDIDRELLERELVSDYIIIKEFVTPQEPNLLLIALTTPIKRIRGPEQQVHTPQRRK
jgi:hypothetical protein